MSVVIAIKYKDGVIMAADKQATSGNLKSDNATKIVQTKYSGLGMGAVGLLKTCNILEAVNEVVDPEDILSQALIDKLYVIRKIVPLLFTAFEKYHCLTKDEDGLQSIHGNLLICSNEKIFSTDGIGAVSEHDDFVAIGCGEQLVHGYLSTLNIDYNKLNENKAIEILATAIEKACKDDVFINDKIDILILKRA